MLFQIETDKVTIDVRAPQSGTLEEILVCMPSRCASSPAVRVNCMCGHHCSQALFHLATALMRAVCHALDEA